MSLVVSSEKTNNQAKEQFTPKKRVLWDNVIVYKKNSISWPSGTRINKTALKKHLACSLTGNTRTDYSVMSQRIELQKRKVH